MKKQMLLASGLFFALNLSLKAQTLNNNSLLRDTFFVTANTNIKVLFLGRDKKEMSKYNKADSLVKLLMADLEKAKLQSPYPSESKTTHYFVHPNSKRRLKAESEDFIEPALNVEKEIQSMNLNLPAYVYIIHDIANKYELQIYTTAPGDLQDLDNINITEAIHSIADDREAQLEIDRIDLSMENGKWIRAKIPHPIKGASIEVGHVSAGVSMIGSRLAPLISPGLFLIYNGKRIIGVQWENYCLSDYKSKIFSNVYYLNSLTVNLNYSAKGLFFSPNINIGIYGGYIFATGGSLDKTFKYGFLIEKENYRISLDLYGPNYKTHGIFGLTINRSLNW